MTIDRFRRRRAPQYTPQGRRRMRGEKGYVLALTGMMLIPLVAFTAFAVDLGSWYAQGVKMQRAADAAALAGVVWAADNSVDATCTGSPPKWKCVALLTTQRNGFSDGVAGVSVTVTKNTDSRITVRVTKPGSLFFGKAFLKNENLGRTSAAEYITPVPMGSPLPSLGNDPDHPQVTVDNPTGQPQFWLNIAGEATDKGSGDQFTSGICSATTVYNCAAGTPPAPPVVNSERSADGYFFKVSVAATTGQPLNIEVYDPAQIYTGDFCESPTDPTATPYVGLPVAGSPTLAKLVTAYPGAANDAANRYVRSSGAGTANQYCTGDQDLNGSNITTTYIVRAPDGTPLSSTDNTALCAISFSPFKGDIASRLLNAAGTGPSTTTYGLENQLLASHFHKQFRICSIPTPVVGDYVIQIRTNALNPASVPPTTTANAGIDATVDTTIGQRSGTTEAGHNRYTLRAHWGATVTSGAGLSTFAEGKLPMYVNVSTIPSTTNFYLAKITKQYAGKILQLKFWDIADGGTAGIEILPPVETPAIGKPTACTWLRDDLAFPAGPVVAGCKVTNMTTANFNARLVTVTIPIPNAYDCDPVAGCWFKIAYTFSSGNPADTTTWSANILGDPVHLVL